MLLRFRIIVTFVENEPYEIPIDDMELYTPSWIEVSEMARNPYIDLPPQSIWIPKHQRMMDVRYNNNPYI
jgi:hypothetical protein